MRQTNIQKYEKQLREMAARISGTAARLEDSVRMPVGGQGDGGLSGTPMHLGDLGSEAYTQELDSALLENETYLRGEVAAALDRIQHGTFGICERCDKPIPLARLDALPQTRYCASCSAKVGDGTTVNMNRGRRPVAYALGDNVADTHAAGTPGGGSAAGGLAGTNVGDGSPTKDLEAAAATSTPDDSDSDEQGIEAAAFAGPSGGAVGGTPANKRARGGKRTAKR